ncbi:hypothetical protein RB213_010881 [Colletotrichum asianum]
MVHPKPTPISLPTCPN